MTYRVEVSRGAHKALLSLPLADQRRIERAIDGLAHNPRPRGAKKLEGGFGELRIRVGVYRIIYDVSDKELRILVLVIGPRKDVYRL